MANKPLTEEQLGGLELVRSPEGCLPAGREQEVCDWLNAEAGRRAEWREFRLLFRVQDGDYRMVYWSSVYQRWYVYSYWWSNVRGHDRFLRPRE